MLQEDWNAVVYEEGSKFVNKPQRTQQIDKDIH